MAEVNFKKHLNLATKFNVLTILLILITSTGICLFMIRMETTSYYDDLLHHGTTVADMTAKNSEFGIYTENRAALLSVLESLSGDPAIAYVSVMNRQHRVLASRVFKGAGEQPARAAIIGNDATKAVHRDLTDRRDGRQYIEIQWPVTSAGSDIRDALLRSDDGKPETAVIGYLRLGLTQEGLQKRIQQMLVSSILFTSVLVIVGIGLTIILTRRITSPLKRLTAATQDVADGKFDSPVEIRTNDELALLARSFDYMRDRLRSFHSQVEKNTADLTATNEQLLQEAIARKSAEEQLQHDALHDSLTGLPNRSLFMDRLVHAMAMANRRKDFLFAVLFVDLDRFKVVNDSLGHLAGDQLLIEVGQRLLTCLRPGDTVARLGGDEFAILLEDIRGLGNATFIAERIVTSMDKPFMVVGQEVFTSASIGITLCVRDYEHPDEVLRDADTAMYKAKSSGRAQYSVFEPGMHTHAVERMRLETDLRRAVERNEFVVFYQPVFSLITNQIFAFEALVRWQHPSRGLLHPADFLKMADETGIIVAIDRFVLSEACRQMQEWMSLYPGSGISFIGMNLSNKQIAQPDVVDHVSHVLAKTGLLPTRLKFEITENVIIENPEETIAILTRLKALGVQLYIDDFGTGYSSLSNLHRLPIDGIKIDRSFIKRMGENGENQEIIKTIMLLARDLNINVISEGLEIEHQTSQIRALGCEYGQGYLFSKPVDGRKAGALFANS